MFRSVAHCSSVHGGGPIAAGRAPEEEVQALGADVAEGDGLWAPEAG